MSICTTTAMKEIYGAGANIRISDCALIFSLAFDVPCTFTQIDKERHAFGRRILSHAFSPSAIKQLQGKIIGQAEKMFGFLVDDRGARDLEGDRKQGGWSNVKNMSELFGYMVSDIINDLCYSRNFDMLGSEKSRGLGDAFKHGATAISIAGYMPWILKLNDWTFLRKYVHGARVFNDTIQTQSADRLAAEKNAETQTDIFSILLEAKDKETGVGLSIPEITSEAGLFTIAGSDTTRATLSSTTFYLLHNPRTLTTLVTELSATFATLSSITYSPALTSCTYLRACIDESLRLSPPIGGVLPRQVLPGGATIDNRFFPEGTDIAVPIYALHHDKRYHVAPFEFRPERWIPASSSSDEEGGRTSEEQVALALSAFYPFGYGPRTCAGRSLAYAELMLVLARLVWMFEMRLVEGMESLNKYRDGGRGRRREGEFQLFDSVVALHDGPWVEFRRRGLSGERMSEGE